MTQNIRDLLISMERQLATLLGWTNVFNMGETLIGTPPAGTPQCRGQAVVPRWTRDWVASGLLLAQYCRGYEIYPTHVTIHIAGMPSVDVAPPGPMDTNTAIRFAIVFAAYTTLKAQAKSLIREYTEAISRGEEPHYPHDTEKLLKQADAISPNSTLAAVKVITYAANLLDTEARTLRVSHNIDHHQPDWEGEVEAKAQHDDFRNTSTQLYELAHRMRSWAIGTTKETA